MSTKCRVPKPLQRKQIWWGEILTGTREQLLETGVVRPEWFPGLPGNNKVCQSVILEADKEPRLVFGNRREARQPESGEKIAIHVKSKHLFCVRYDYSTERKNIQEKSGSRRAGLPANQPASVWEVTSSFHDEISQDPDVTIVKYRDSARAFYLICHVLERNGLAVSWKSPV